jgi:hypothetical protein
MKKLITFLICMLPVAVFAQISDINNIEPPYYNYDSAMVKPVFPGGTQALTTYIDTILQYPFMALQERDFRGKKLCLKLLRGSVLCSEYTV